VPGFSALLVLVAVAFGTALVISLAVYAHVHADVPAARAFRNLEASVGCWGVFELSIYLSSPTSPALEALYTVRLFFAGAAAILAIVFVAEYTQSSFLNRPAVRRLLWSVFGGAMVLWVVNPGGLAHEELAVETFQGITVIAPEFGPLFALYFLFVYGFWLVAFTVLGQFLLDSTNVYRTQTALIFVALLIVVVGTVALLLGVAPHEGIDMGTVFSALAGVIIWTAVYQYDFLTVVPLAKEAIIDTVVDPVLVLDEDDRLIYANNAAEVFDLTDEDHNETIDVLLPDLRAALADDNIYRQETQGDAGSGRVFEPVGETIVDHHGVERGQVVVMRDVTERHRREQRLDEFASVVSHDLRNPLNVASGYVDLASETGETDHLDDAKDAFARMEQLIDDLLAISRAEYEDIETSPVSLPRNADAAWVNVETGESTLQVDTDAHVRANESRLQELFENLFRNAVQHNDRPVTVRVGVQSDGFFLADDGRGIPAAKREEMFEAGTTTAKDGTGFGLYIVQQIASAHGWTVTVEESADGGARFEFSTGNEVPVTDAESSLPDESAESSDVDSSAVD